MELCIKTEMTAEEIVDKIKVSILVLMELCIKTLHLGFIFTKPLCFNPCFNGTMYKNGSSRLGRDLIQVFQSLF